MTEEDQLLAIARISGLANPRLSKWCGSGEALRPIYDGEGSVSNPGCEQLIPDYLHDMNAIYAAEEKAGPQVIEAMRFWLYEFCGQMHAHHATAAQRAEALLRAAGLWKGINADQ